MAQSRILEYDADGFPIDWEDPPFIEGQHHWVIWHKIESCLWCGRCRPRDPAKERTCKGKTLVSLR